MWNDPEDVLLSYSLRPLVDDMVRRYTVGARSGARVVAFGIVKGLYEDREEPVWDHPMVEEYLADEPSASAVAVLETAAEWDPDFPRHRLAEIAPDWADILKR